VDVALTLAQTARQGMPNSPGSADTLAWAYYSQGNLRIRPRSSRRRRQKRSQQRDHAVSPGNGVRKMMDKSNAAIHLKKAISLAPDSPAAKDAKAALQGIS
jgi:hypothetical protein